VIRVQFNAGPVLARLADARAKLTDMRPVFQDVGEYLVTSTRKRLVAGTAPDGRRWRAKSPTTLAAYLRRGDGARPDPLIGPSRRLSTEIGLIVTADSAEVGSSLIYSAVQQFGARKGSLGPRSPWGDIPARPFLGLSPDDERTIVEIVDEHLDEATGGDGAPA
jgi:phage virion morphogenesis protein